MTVKIPVLLFVHIPKTAGTSFRSGLMQIFKRRDVLFDYGPVALETDQRIKFLYEEKPFTVGHVAELIDAKNIRMLCGHFPYCRYAPVLPEARVVSFVREPLQRCYSEYLHSQRYKGYGKSFVEFFEQTWQVNLQSKWLGGMGDEALIGVSEYYRLSVGMMSKALGVSLPTLILNAHRKNISQPYSLDIIGSKVAEQFYSLNQDDVFLYEKIASSCREGFEAESLFSQAVTRIKSKFCAFSFS